MKHLKSFNKLNEGINDTRFGDFKSSIFHILFFPLTIPILANTSTDFKIKALIKSTISNYIEEKAEYRILEDGRFDIEQPSILSRITKRMRMIDKKFEKRKTLEEHLKLAFKVMRKIDLINFRNSEDFDYMCDKVEEHFSVKTEEQWIEDAMRKLTLNKKTGKIDRIGGFQQRMQDNIAARNARD